VVSTERAVHSASCFWWRRYWMVQFPPKH